MSGVIQIVSSPYKQVVFSPQPGFRSTSLESSRENVELVNKIEIPREIPNTLNIQREFLSGNLQYRSNFRDLIMGL